MVPKICLILKCQKENEKEGGDEMKSEFNYH